MDKKKCISVPGQENKLKRRRLDQQSCYMACSLNDIARIVPQPQNKNERPGNSWHPKHATYGLMQSAAMPALVSRQGEEQGARIIRTSLTDI